MQFEQRELNQRFDLLSKAIWVWYTAGLTVTEGFYRTGDAKGRCRSSARRWPCYRCTAAVPVRLCHELFSISTKPGAQLHSGNEWGETRRQNGGWAMVACGRRGNREGRRCWGHAVGSPEEVGKQEALGSYDTSWDFSWVGATCAWRWSLIVSGDAWIKTAVQFLLFLSFFFFFSLSTNGCLCFQLTFQLICQNGCCILEQQKGIDSAVQPQRTLTCSRDPEPSFILKAVANAACLVPNLSLKLFTQIVFLGT